MSHLTPESVFGPLRRLDAKHVGWQEIQQTSHLKVKEGRIARVLGHLRQPSADKVRSRLDDCGEPMRQQIASSIIHTVSFAKNTLEAEAESYRRRGIQRLDASDFMATGPHYPVKQRGAADLRMEGPTRSKAHQIVAMREALPVRQPGMLQIEGSQVPLFMGTAELYGMARAGYSPGSLESYFTHSGVIGTNERTSYFLRDSDMVVNMLSDPERSVQDVLAEELSVNLAEALTIADNPTPGVMYGAALRIIDAQQ